MSNTRLSYLDLAAGIMTLWVMYFHAPLYHVPILYFFMPWFFYKSGQMFKFRPYNEELHKGWQKLIRPFIIWSLIGYAAYIIWGLCTWGLSMHQAFYTPLHSLFFSCCIPLNNALWFLPILFLVRTIGNYILPRVNHKLFLIIDFALLCVLAVIRSHYVPIWISHTAWGLFFFTIGYDLREWETNKIVFSVASVLFVLSFLTPIPVFYNDMSQSLPWHEIMWYLCGVCGCVAFNNICRMADRVTAQVSSQGGVLHYIGKHAINFYVPHFILFKLSYDIVGTYKEEWYDNWQGRLIVVLSYIVFLPIINQIIIKIESLKNAK